MGHTDNTREPESVLHLSDLDVELVQVTVEQRDNGIEIQLYAKE